MADVPTPGLVPLVRGKKGLRPCFMSLAKTISEIVATFDKVFPSDKGKLWATILGVADDI